MVVPVEDAAEQLEALIERVLHGEEVLLSDGGTLVARLVPYDDEPQADAPGRLRGQGRNVSELSEVPLQRSADLDPIAD